MTLQSVQEKTGIVYQPAHGMPGSEPSITVNGQTMQVVDKVFLLGSTLVRAAHINGVVTVRTAKPSVAFSRLRRNVREQNGIRLS